MRSFVWRVVSFFVPYLLLHQLLDSRLVNDVMSEETIMLPDDACPFYHAETKTQTIPMGKRPSVTWLLSFPNSGTSFTITSIQTTSNLSAATNYADEISVHETLLPVYPDIRDDSSNGPWRLDIQLQPPAHRVLCKTHCSGYGDSASLSQSVNTLDSFLIGCQRTIGRGTFPRKFFQYKAQNLVESAIHLIRNPFDNVISRMHLGMKRVMKRSHRTDDELGAFVGTKKALQDWCDYEDGRFWMFHTMNSSILHISEEITSVLTFDPRRYIDVPCHAEFFRYTQWHNLALEMIRSLNLSVITIRYDDYESRYNQTIDRILDFLGQKRVLDPLPFTSGKNYQNNFFDCSTQSKIKELVKAVSSKDTWVLLHPYFISPFSIC